MLSDKVLLQRKQIADKAWKAKTAFQNACRRQMPESNASLSSTFHATYTYNPDWTYPLGLFNLPSVNGAEKELGWPRPKSDMMFEMLTGAQQTKKQNTIRMANSFSLKMLPFWSLVPLDFQLIPWLFFSFVPRRKSFLFLLANFASSRPP